MNYQDELKKLMMKVITFIVPTVMFAVILMFVMTNANLFSCVLLGSFIGLFFYIPYRVRQFLHCGWIGAIVITIVFFAVIIWLAKKIGDIVNIVLLLPIVDICYSIYIVIKLKKDNPPEKK